MAITLSGKIINDSGQGINGVSVNAYRVGEISPSRGSGTTATVGGEDGIWSITALPEGYRYHVTATVNSKVREVFYGADVQFKSLYVGDTVIGYENDPTNGTSVNSNKLHFRGAYDSDAGVGVTVTPLEIACYLVTAADGTYKLSFVNKDLTEIARIDQAGNFNATTVTVNGAGINADTVDNLHAADLFRSHRIHIKSWDSSWFDSVAYTVVPGTKLTWLDTFKGGTQTVTLVINGYVLAGVTGYLQLWDDTAGTSTVEVTITSTDTNSVTTSGTLTMVNGHSYSLRAKVPTGTYQGLYLQAVHLLIS